MASPKSGKKVGSTSPTVPTKAEEADLPDPVEMAKIKAEQREKGEGKYGSQKAPPFKPIEDEEVETSWIEIELIDEEDEPVAGERYELELPDGSIKSGTLNGDGYARIEGFEPGQCRISFPELDADAWEPA